MDKRDIKRSREDYLEAILININRSGACRVTDVARQMGFSRASASIALKKLEEEGFVVRDDWRVLLTDAGREIADKVYEKHRFFRTWFERLGVSPETAEEDACLIEHILSEETYQKIREHICRCSN